MFPVRALIALLLSFVLVLAAPARAQQSVVVASKMDTEGALLGNLIALVLESAGVPVETRLQLGSTAAVRAALLSGEVDIYPEYTGNGALFFSEEAGPAWRQPQAAYDRVKQLDAERHSLIWLARAPANNAWLIAVRGDVARPNRLATMEDFADHLREFPHGIKLAGSVEFANSPAALPAFERTYGFALPREQILTFPGGDTTATMRAAAERRDGVNASMVYGTDGGIAALDLVVMSDPKGAQIVYEPAPVVRTAVLERHPTIGPALSRVFASLSLARLQRLNAMVAVEGRSPREVAREYLRQESLVR